MTQNKPIQIAIDGPVGAGKGTVAIIVRNKINGSDVYTGGTYRAVALYCLKNNISVEDREAVLKVLDRIQIEVDNDQIFLDGENITEQIKRNEVASATSKVSVIGEVRKKMVDVQKKGIQKIIERGENIVVEGRDIGTVVMPEADLKIFLTADVETRARRRVAQLEKIGDTTDFEKVKEQIIERDKRDSEREIDPLPTHPESLGYMVIDNSSQTVEQTVDAIMNELKKRNLQ